MMSVIFSLLEWWKCQQQPPFILRRERSRARSRARRGEFTAHLLYSQLAVLVWWHPSETLAWLLLLCRPSVTTAWRTALTLRWTTTLSTGPEEVGARTWCLVVLVDKTEHSHTDDATVLLNPGPVAHSSSHQSSLADEVDHGKCEERSPWPLFQSVFTGSQSLLLTSSSFVWILEFHWEDLVVLLGRSTEERQSFPLPDCGSVSTRP